VVDAWACLRFAAAVGAKGLPVVMVYASDVVALRPPAAAANAMARDAA
jgi:hypothetical protein